MTLQRRMWLTGAALPVLVLAAVLFAADRLFHLALERSLDRALLAQAAVEAVSLFDGPEHGPHLHMATSPLVDSVRPFAPEGVLFGPDGQVAVRYPPPRKGTVPEVLRPEPLGTPPAFATRVEGASRFRALAVTVQSPGGDPYTLRLSASLAQVDQSVETFHVSAVACTLAMAVLLAALQGWQARRIGRRLGELHQHLEAVKAGDLSGELADERETDELADLRTVLAGATREVARARGAQERLLADAAHELRTPLTVMRTSLDLALRRERSPAELKATLGDVREECDRLAELAMRLLDTIAVGKGDFRKEPHDVAALVRDAVAAVEATAQSHGVRVEIVGPATLTAPVHRPSLRQALDNLLSNALKFAPHGTRVVVDLSSGARGLSLGVQDEGPGIPAEERERVFAPFHRVRGSQPGTGLGLTIVQEVARAHGGTAFVADSARGARVVLELPTA